jgi:hypothetical protein
MWSSTALSVAGSVGHSNVVGALAPAAAKQGSKTNAGPPGLVCAVKHRYDEAPATPNARHRVAVAVLMTSTPGAGMPSAAKSVRLRTKVPVAVSELEGFALLVAPELTAPDAAFDGGLDVAVVGGAVCDVRVVVWLREVPHAPRVSATSATSATSTTSPKNRGRFMSMTSSTMPWSGRVNDIL